MKNILITGSSGTIGTRLCERLLSEGYRVTGVDRSPNRWNREIHAMTHIGDLRDSGTLESLPSSFDLVIHLAANARVHNLVIEPSLAFENMESTFQILEFCRKNAIPRLIFASSREVYGNTAEWMQHSEDEVNIGYCESPYTASKMCGEALVKAYSRCYGIQHIVARFSNVYGMYDVSDRLIPLFIRRARQDQSLIVYGQHKILDCTYIDDTVAGICRCIQRFDTAANLTLNIASGRGARIIDVAKMIVQSVGSASQVVCRDNRTGEVHQFVADISAARKHLGYEPRVMLEEGVSRAIGWYSRCTDADWLGGIAVRTLPPGTQSAPSRAPSHIP